MEVKHVYGLLGSRGGGTGRLYFRDTRVPARNLVGPLDGGFLVFNRMMVPERLTTAAGALGMARCCLEVATRYSDRRKAFGETIRKFEAVSFKVADSIAKLDAARSLVYVTARHVDEGLDSRRMVSEAIEDLHRDALGRCQLFDAGDGRNRIHECLSGRAFLGRR